MSTTRARARARPPNEGGVFDEILADGYEGGDLGAGVDQGGALHEGSAGGGVEEGGRRALVERNNITGGSGAEGDGENITREERRIADIEELGDNGNNSEDMTPDESHKGGNLMSGGQAFPPSLLTSPSNLSDHFA